MRRCEQEDGSYMHTVVLGDTRCESFYICLGGIIDYSFYPACSRGTPTIFVEGPDNKMAGKYWMIDGRDEEVRMGSVYQIKFFWGQNRKRVTWEEVLAEDVARVLRIEHRYQITGSWTSGRKDDLKKGDGIWEYRSKIGVSGREEFMLIRDGDDQQMIYPAQRNCTKTGVPVRGPDHLGDGKMWVVNGPVGELVTVRLEVEDGRIIMVVVSKSIGARVWESVKGWDRHTYWLAFRGGRVTRMAMDLEAPGVYRAHTQIGQNFIEQYRGFCEFFNVIVDEDPNTGFCPDVACASSGECIVWGPERGCSDRPFLVKSWQSGADFEVVLDLRAVDRRRVVTWAWAAPPQLIFEGYSAAMDA